MKPLEHILNLGYALCKCRHCKKPKKKRVDRKSAARQEVKKQIEKEINNGNVH